jgi:hypothetical protein
MRVKSLLAVAMLCAIGTAACGSSSKSSTGSVTSAPGASGTTSPSGATTSTPDGGSTTTIKLSGSTSSDFCDLARADDKAFSDDSPAGQSIADLKKQYQALGPALQKAADKAPSAIKGDFEVFLNAFKPYLQALADANYDVTKIDASQLTGLESPAVTAASDHIEQYFTQVCHITPPAS